MVHYSTLSCYLWTLSLKPRILQIYLISGCSRLICYGVSNIDYRLVNVYKRLLLTYNQSYNLGLKEAKRNLRKNRLPKCQHPVTSPPKVSLWQQMLYCIDVYRCLCCAVWFNVLLFTVVLYRFIRRNSFSNFTEKSLWREGKFLSEWAVVGLTQARSSFKCSRGTVENERFTINSKFFEYCILPSRDRCVAQPYRL